MTQEHASPIVIYEDADKAVEVQLDADQKTVWLNLQQLVELFGRDKSVISRHPRNIFKEGELAREATVAKNATVQLEGARQVQRDIELYNLDAIISVGYRVNSSQATRFRQWATRVLREHLTQGWTLNRHRFEENARELEAALALVRKTASSPELTAGSADDSTKSWRKLFGAVPFEDKGGFWQARYYQHNAINQTLEAFAAGHERILLTLATGTGKTAIAFQIAWKLFHARWSLAACAPGEPARQQRFLFLADRNNVLMRPINSIIEFKQIIGRGTRLYDGKDYFTIYDFGESAP